MSIISESELGWVLDHELYLNNIYTNCMDLSQSDAVRQQFLKGYHPKGSPTTSRTCRLPKPETSAAYRQSQHNTGDSSTVQCPHIRYCFRQETFAINEPFKMDTWFLRQQQRKKNEEAVDEAHGMGVTGTGIVRKKKKRKRSVTQNAGEIEAEEFYNKVKPKLLAALAELIPMAQKERYFTPGKPDVKNNNELARQTAAMLQDGGSPLKDWCIMARNFQTDSHQEVYLDDTGEWDADLPSLVNVLVHHRCSRPTVRHLMGESYLLPPNSTFLISDITQMEPFFSEQKFDLIVMDPPWNNASVRRKRKYCQLTNTDLLQLPMVAAPGALLAVWTTNRMAHHRFIRTTLLPHWNAHFVAHWFWVKTTKSGEAVCEWDSEHSKRPYESLMLGRVAAADHTATPPLVPPHRVIISVPCSLHSSKPPLTEILRPYIPPGGKCLELFARNLLPNWTSWGNETVLFQNINFFKREHNHDKVT